MKKELLCKHAECTGDRHRHRGIATRLAWRDNFNLAKGAAFGLSHNFMQVGYLRPQNRHRRYRNLYFAGASTHPGTGLPIVLLSARLTSERILQDWGREQLVAGQPLAMVTG